MEKKYQCAKTMLSEVYQVFKKNKKEAKNQHLTIPHVMQGFCPNKECSFKKIHLAENYSDQLHQFINTAFSQECPEERVLLLKRLLLN